MRKTPEAIPLETRKTPESIIPVRNTRIRKFLFPGLIRDTDPGPVRNTDVAQVDILQICPGRACRRALFI